MHREGSHWPHECVLRADYLHSQILKALGQEEEAHILEAASVEKMQRILLEHSPTALKGSHVRALPELDQTPLFDRIVPLYAGRFAIFAPSPRGARR